MSREEDLKKALDEVEAHLRDKYEYSPESKHYDKEGKTMSLAEWALRFEDKDYRAIRTTDAQEDCTISTVWLGLPHGMGPNGPLIFETMVFDHEGEEMEVYRYATEEEAIRNHEYLVDVHGGLKRKSESNIRHRKRMRAITEEEDD